MNTYDLLLAAHKVEDKPWDFDQTTDEGRYINLAQPKNVLKMIEVINAMHKAVRIACDYAKNYDHSEFKEGEEALAAYKELFE
jgi:hypothetical protein